jgi:hypothetical protein
MFFFMFIVSVCIARMAVGKGGVNIFLDFFEHFLDESADIGNRM